MALKALTKDVVKAAAELLILTHGKISNLEVKIHLRNLGYCAEQATVSRCMMEIHEESQSTDKPLDYNRIIGAVVYREYFFKTIKEAEEDETTTPTTMGQLVATPSIVKQKLPDAKVKHPDITQLKPVDIQHRFAENDIVAYTNKFSNQPLIVFDGDISRDHARVMFERITGIDYHDARAMRVKNILKTHPSFQS